MKTTLYTNDIAHYLQCSDIIDFDNVLVAKLADKLRKIAKNIESKTPKCKNAFAELLRHDNSNVRMWCAHHILEVMNYDDETRKNALLIIKDASFVSYGEKLWLKNWINNNPQDALLI